MIKNSKSCFTQSVERIEKRLKTLNGFEGVAAELKTIASSGIRNYSWFTEIETRPAEQNAEIWRQAKKRKRRNPVFFNESETRKIRDTWRKGISRFNQDGNVSGLLAIAKKVASLMKDAIINHIYNGRSEAGKMKANKPYVQRIKDACYGADKPVWVRTGQLVNSLKTDSNLIK